MTALLERIARSAEQDVRTYAESLLAAEQPPPVPDSGAPLPLSVAEQALSEREGEVLRLLATDLTGPQIARQLFVSVNTLRTHTKHIFAKLDVNTRRAAVRRAVDLGLLRQSPTRSPPVVMRAHHVDS